MATGLGLELELCRGITPSQRARVGLRSTAPPRGCSRPACGAGSARAVFAAEPNGGGGGSLGGSAGPTDRKGRVELGRAPAERALRGGHGPQPLPVTAAARAPAVAVHLTGEGEEAKRTIPVPGQGQEKEPFPFPTQETIQVRSRNTSAGVGTSWKAPRQRVIGAAQGQWESINAVKLVAAAQPGSCKPACVCNIRSPRRHRSSSSSPLRLKERRDEEKKEVKDSKSKERQITEEDLQGKTEEEIEMMKMMGFASFDTTKGKKVDGAANAYAINVSQKRKYRQYMNRKGGFNRPLDFIA